MLEKSIPLIPVSIGEIVDKISILKIKYKKITDIAKLKNVDIELQELKLKFEDLGAFDQIETEIKNLDIVNEQLWKIEDDIREKEKKKEFDDDFIKLARSVYQINDKRALYKKEINLKTGSLLIEEKSYSNY